VLMGTATTVDEAKVLADAGVDIVVASGFEAGGHRGSFLRKAEDSLMGTISLIPQVSDAVNLPVIAAGGIADARGVVAAFALGAEAVQVGTVFLACNDSGASEVHRNALLSGKAAVTGLTRGFTGRLARAIKNELMDELNATHAQILPYPLQRHLIRSLSIAAENAQEESLLPMWSGQSAALIKSTDVESVMDSLLKDISKPLDALLRWKQL
jgi:nitronate monooxygenase